MEYPAGLPGWAESGKDEGGTHFECAHIIGTAFVSPALRDRRGCRICLMGFDRARIFGSLGISPWKLPFKEVIYVRGHKNRWQTIQSCCWRKN